MNRNNKWVFAAMGLAGCLSTVALVGCNSSAQQATQQNKAAAEAKTEQLQGIQQNPNIPDSVKAQIAASAQGQSANTGKQSQ
jgi:CHASE1-domain containing sensor protein